MPHTYEIDYILTHVHIPKLSSEFCSKPKLIQKLKVLENGHIHEGRFIVTSYVDLEPINRAFKRIDFDCLLDINESVCPRFLLEFYSQVKIKRNQDYSIYFRCCIGQYKFSLSLEQFAQILGLPYHGQCAYSEVADLDSLLENQEKQGPYRKFIPPKDKIIKSLCNSSTTHPNKILLTELRMPLQAMAIILRENVVCLMNESKYVPASCAHMLYCILTGQPYNLAYFFAKRIMQLKDNNVKLMPYGMLLTRLLNYFMDTYPYLQNPLYQSYHRVMAPISREHISSFINPEQFPIDDILDEELRKYQERSIEED